MTTVNIRAAASIAHSEEMGWQRLSGLRNQSIDQGPVANPAGTCQNRQDSQWKSMSFKRGLAILPAALLAHGLFASAALAYTVARANGRCSLKQNGYEAFNGYCTVKQKQNGPTTVFCY